MAEYTFLFWVPDCGRWRRAIESGISWTVAHWWSDSQWLFWLLYLALETCISDEMWTLDAWALDAGCSMHHKYPHIATDEHHWSFRKSNHDSNSSWVMTMLAPLNVSSGCSMPPTCRKHLGWLIQLKLRHEPPTNTLQSVLGAAWTLLPCVILSTLLDVPPSVSKPQSASVRKLLDVSPLKLTRTSFM